ncbi:hypothetical protein LG943_06845 [Streptomonospora sp. S1-112]|uniref:PH domain-containing protein n=1 Tax=Streptomonospora mangrovi TaxID=2883123 RepID=A0A9X3SGE8_9ACTN|nr:hypothetical protein [Streptomonospora mangrovi]MDA0564044.1 hypothetical protein [Streptomonospora mangrovi]
MLPLPPTDGDLVLRPPRSTVWRVLTSAAVITVVAAVVAWNRAGWAVALGGGLLLLGLAAVLAVHMFRSSIVLTPHEIVVTGLGRPRRRPRAQAAHVLRATLVAPRGGPYHNLFVLDAYGRLLIRLHGTHYTYTDLDRLVRAMGLPVGGPDRPVTAGVFARMYPGILPWAERHPWAVAFTAGGAVVLLILAAFISVTVLW